MIFAVGDHAFTRFIDPQTPEMDGIFPRIHLFYVESSCQDDQTGYRTPIAVPISVK